MTSTAKPGAMKARKRIALACNGCRTKRTKCDGDQPKCSSCSYREEECVYTDSESKRKRPSNAYILALESRVEFLERHLEAALGTPGKYTTTTSSRSDIYSPISNKNGDLSSLTSDPPRESRTPRDQTSVDDLTEALGCFTLGDTGELRFFGASSNFNIIQNPSLKVASSLEARSRGIAAARQRAGYFEPSAELRDHLLGLFWRWQNSWQYIVCRESFVRDLYMEKTGRYCTPLLLMAIMALSSRYSPRPELRTDAADANTAGAIFAQQAKTMLDCEYEAPTTSTVQATAILGLYWASIDNEGQGFMYIGMASRMAMNLGLHCDCSYYATKGLISQKDVEERSIAFWGIYVLDKLYCLGMGRPASIQERNITTPKPIVKDYPVPQLSGPLKKISSPWPTYHITENSLYTCELLMFTSEVIDKLYAQRSEWTDQEREDGVMQIHLRATRFLDHLPKTLKISYSSLQPSPPYAYQLHLQYYHSIVLLHRPFLNHFSGSRQSIEYDPSGGDIHSSSCRSAAVRICEILRIYGKNFRNRHLPVSAVHPAFTAAILLLLDLKMRQDRNINTEASAKAFKETKHYLSISVVALYEMNINWNWANRSIRAVQSLAAQWRVDLSTLDLERVPDECWGQYNLYVSECITTEQLQTPLTGVTEQGDENGSTAPAFDFPPWLNGISSLPPFDQTIDPHPDPDPLDDSQFWANMGLLFGCQEP